MLLSYVGYPSLRKDTKLSADEKTRFPVNLLVLKAMHDRERLATLAASVVVVGGDTSDDDTLDASDREAMAKAAHFSSFAAAAYGVMGNFAKLKELVAKEESMPPAELLYDMWALCLIFPNTFEGQGVFGCLYG